MLMTMNSDRGGTELVVVKPYRPVKGRQDPLRRLQGARNFWVGVAQAILMRASLRKVHGHVPYGGTTPTGGEHWTALESYQAAALYDTAVWLLANGLMEHVGRVYADPRTRGQVLPAVQDSRSPERLQPSERLPKLRNDDVSIYRLERTAP